jgi:hypothetical protein
VSATPVIGLEHVEIIRELLAVGVGKETTVFSSRTPSLIHSLELSGGYQNIATLTGGDIEKKNDWTAQTKEVTWTTLSSS